MATKPTYSISLTVFREDTGEVIGERVSALPEVIEMSMADIPKWIENWERENLIMCSQCQEMTLVEDVSYKSTDPEHQEPICQDCLEKIIHGDQKVKETN